MALYKFCIIIIIIIIIIMARRLHDGSGGYESEACDVGADFRRSRSAVCVRTTIVTNVSPRGAGSRARYVNVLGGQCQPRSTKVTDQSVV